jgi:VanZ family protein
VQKITKRLLVLKNLLLSLAVAFTVFLSIINFVNLKEVPKVGLGFEDKLYHVGAYMVFSFLWAYWTLMRFSTPLLKTVFLLCLAYGVLMESLQQMINPSRTFDLGDLLSNCIGVVIGMVIAAQLSKRKVKLK